jgi:hypothetical protein
LIDLCQGRAASTLYTRNMDKEIGTVRDRIARYRTLLGLNTDREAQKIIREFLAAAETELEMLQTRKEESNCTASGRQG